MGRDFTAILRNQSLNKLQADKPRTKTFIGHNNNNDDNETRIVLAAANDLNR